MLEKRRRVPRELFTKIFESQKKGLKHANSPHFSLSALIEKEKVSRAAVSVSKKVSKKAVSRNKVRRRAYSILHKLLPRTEPGVYFLSARQSADKIKFDETEKEIEALFGKFLK